jgi:diadenosine tetraphosphate (Ap4A) HIT family hydrolase
MNTGLYQKYHAGVRHLPVDLRHTSSGARTPGVKQGVFPIPEICYIIMKMRADLHAGGEALNATMRKFGAPGSLIKGYEYWSVLLRQSQLTLGALILAAHGPATSWAELDPGSFAELGRVIPELEAALKKAFRYEKLNYLMLMMVDRHVHFHVIPRYSNTQQFAGRTFVDAGWPGPPDLGRSNETDPEADQRIRSELVSCWPRGENGLR